MIHYITTVIFNIVRLGTSWYWVRDGLGTSW